MYNLSHRVAGNIRNICINIADFKKFEKKIGHHHHIENKLKKLESLVCVREIITGNSTTGNLTLVEINHETFKVKQIELKFKQLLRDHKTLVMVVAMDAVRDEKSLKRQETKTGLLKKQKEQKEKVEKIQTEKERFDTDALAAAQLQEALDRGEYL